MLDVIVSGVSFEDQDTVVFHLDLVDRENRVEYFTAVFDILDLAGKDVMSEIKKAVKMKLVAELDLAQYIGETFTVDPIYRKAYGD